MCYKAQMLGQWDGFYVQCTTINHGFTHLDAFKVVAAPFSERFINHLVSSSESLSSNPFSSQQEPGEPPKSRPKNHWLMKSRMGIIPLGVPSKFVGFMGSYHLIMMFLLNLKSWGCDGTIPFSRPKKSQESLVHHIPMIFPHCIPMLYSDKC